MDNILIIFHKFDYLSHNNFFALYLCVKMISYLIWLKLSGTIISKDYIHIQNKRKADNNKKLKSNYK